MQFGDIMNKGKTLLKPQAMHANDKMCSKFEKCLSLTRVGKNLENGSLILTSNYEVCPSSNLEKPQIPRWGWGWHFDSQCINADLILALKFEVFWGLRMDTPQNSRWGWGYHFRGFCPPYFTEENKSKHLHVEVHRCILCYQYLHSKYSD